MMRIGRRWSDQKAICRAILCGRAEEAFRTYGVPPLEQPIYQRLAEEALENAIARRTTARRYFRARIRNPIRISTLLSSTIGIISFAFGLWLFWRVDFSDAQTFPLMSSVAAVWAIGVAAVGWGVSAWIAHRNNRSKYTLDTVAARYSQPAFSEALKNFNAKFKGVRISEQLVTQMSSSTDLDDLNAVQSLRYLLNYFEFLAVGILHGELDERIVARTMRGNLIYVYDHAAKYITELQASNPKTLENFSLVRMHFQER